MEKPPISKRFQGDRDDPGAPRESAWRLSRTGIPPSGGVRQPAVRAGMVDGGRELLRQHLGKLVDRNVEARRELLDGVAAEHLLQLLGRNRQVLAVADPGFDLIPK